MRAAFLLPIVALLSRPARAEEPAPPPGPVVQIRASLGWDGGVAPAQMSAAWLAGVGLRWPSFSLSAEARGTAPAPGGNLPEAEAMGYRIAGDLVPCYHRSVGPSMVPMHFCAVVAAGNLHVRATVPSGKTVNVAMLQTGGRVGADMPIVNGIDFRLSFEVVGNLHAAEFRVGDTVSWAVQALSVSTLAGLVKSF